MYLNDVTRKFNNTCRLSKLRFNLETSGINIVEKEVKFRSKPSKDPSPTPIHVRWKNGSDKRQLLPYRNGSPMNSKVYGVNPKWGKECHAYLMKQVKEGRIRPSTSPWTSLAFFNKKTDQTPRLLVDYQELNKKTVKDREIARRRSNRSLRKWHRGNSTAALTVIMGTTKCPWTTSP
eukprot:PhF_6_TR40202/c0_g1_i5/m.59688